MPPAAAAAALACLKHSARAALIFVAFAASAGSEAARNGTSKAMAERVLVLCVVASLKEITPSLSGGRARAERLPDFCQPGSEHGIGRGRSRYAMTARTASLLSIGRLAPKFRRRCRSGPRRGSNKSSESAIEVVPLAPPCRESGLSCRSRCCI
jgi:hypothetical protein